MQHLNLLRQKHWAHSSRPSVACCASKKQKGSPWQQKQQQGSSSSSSQAAAKLSEAAKAAAKRAAQFAKQRQQRDYQLAQQEADSTYGFAAATGSSSNGPTSSRGLAAAAKSASPGQYADLRPYAEVVSAHLKQQQAASNNSSSSSGRGRGAKKAASRDLLEAHTAVFQAALDLELQQEWQEAEERLKSWPRSRLASEGVALFGLAAAPDGAVARDVVLRFFAPEQALPFHSFSQGDILLVSQGDPLGDSHEAIVVDFSSRWIRLAMNPTAAAAVAAAAGSSWSSSSSSGSNGGGIRRNWRPIWRLDLFANTVSHERCSEALHRFAGAVTQQQQQQQGSAGEFVDRQGLLSGLLTQGQLQQQEALCRVLAGVVSPGTSLEAAAAQAPPWLKTPQGRERLAAARASVKTLVQGKQLNPSQATAITTALTRTVTLWQGPPGTGKTTTLLRFCEAALSVLPAGGGGGSGSGSGNSRGGGSKLLAVAASNVAVDQLVTGLLDLGVKVVRVGQPAKVTPALRSVTLEALAAATAPGQQAAKLRQQLAEAAAANRGRVGGGSGGRSGRSGGRGGDPRGGRGGGRGSGGVGIAAGGMWEQMLALEAAAAAEVLGQAHVVAATCVGAGDPVLQERFFDVCVLDEATQAPEPAALVVAAQRVQSLIMVGDPQQLPPTVRCQEAQRLGLGFSLFERVQAMGLKPLLLDTQYRMHPRLAEFPSAKFYGGLLQSWPKPSDRPLPPGLSWPNPQVPVMFIQCRGPEARTAASFSISRQRETVDSTDADDGDADDGAVSRNGSSSRNGRRSSSSSSAVDGSSPGDGAGDSGGAGGYSYFNAAEADVVVRCLQQLLGAGMQPEDMCVITPYSGQVRSIQRLLTPDAGSSSRQQQQQRRPSLSGQHRDSSSSNKDSSTPSQSPSGSKTSRPSAPATAATVATATASLSVLEVKSVDGFQGREKEVVLFSAVRSNSSGRVGFLSDSRRLNVALTRAKRGLVVVGDAATLRRDRVWAAWLGWAKKQGVIVAEGGAAVSDDEV